MLDTFVSNITKRKTHQKKQTLQERIMQLYKVPTEGPFWVCIRLMQVYLSLFESGFESYKGGHEKKKF